MPDVTFSFPTQAALQRVVDSTVGLFPIPTHPLTGAKLYTPAQWAKEFYRRQMVQNVRRWEGQQADKAIVEDNTIAQ